VGDEAGVIVALGRVTEATVNAGLNSEQPLAFVTKTVYDPDVFAE
jgi:hypothetical protein